MHSGRIAHHDQQGRVVDSDGNLQSGRDVIDLEQQRRLCVVGFERERVADFDDNLYRHGYQRCGHRGVGIGDGDGEPAADLHADAFAFHDQPGWILDSDGGLHSGCDVLHVDRHGVCDVGIERERVAEFDSELFGGRA